MGGFFRSRKAASPPPEDEPDDDRPRVGGLASRLNVKEVELYPTAIRLLWHYFDPEDRGKEEGRPKEFPGPIDDTVADSVKELEKVRLIEVVPTFSDFGVTAKLTRVGLQLMSGQTESGRLAQTEVTDTSTGAITVYRAVNLGFS